MASQRRIGAESSRTRIVLLDCAEQLMVHEGYAAVTYRGLAARAKVTPALVQYYFPALDDLFIAMVRRRTEESLERLAAAVEGGSPLRALWEYAAIEPVSWFTPALAAPYAPACGIARRLAPEEMFTIAPFPAASIGVAAATDRK
jgi:AcrR family transcriptional regulator